MSEQVSIQDIRDLLQSGKQFTWFKVGCIDFIQRPHYVEVLYPQDVEEGTVFDHLHERQDVIDYIRLDHPTTRCWTDPFT